MKIALVVPSRKRAGNMERIMRLLPTASICVDEREEADYRRVVPKKKLVLHERTSTLGEVRRWILGHYKERIVVMVDDDFRGVNIWVGRRRRMTRDPGAIAQIIETTAQVADDMNVALFGWGRWSGPRDFQSHDPMMFRCFLSNAWGVIGREFRIDKRLNLCESVDLTLQNLLRRRIVFVDNRYYFDCGEIWGGAGGLQGIRTADGQEWEKKLMQSRWGKHLNLETRKKGGSTGMRILVKRKQTRGVVKTGGVSWDGDEMPVELA